MRFDILTLFPEMFAPLDLSMIGRAVKNGLIDFNVVNIRDFSRDKHKKTDDTPFGGGHGMVMMTDPIFRAMKSIGVDPDGDGPADAAGRNGHDAKGGGAPRRRVIYMSPRGRLLNKAIIEDLSHEDEVVILCGHYEGVDQRVLDHFGVEEISVGDYILTGGELPAMILVDAVARMIPGVLAKEEAALDESVYSGLLEYPQYTQPRDYEGLEVPEVLLNGNHELTDLWKFEQSLRLTRERRADLFEKFVSEVRSGVKKLSKKQQKILSQIRSE
ncbi:MAG: tRNA (guanosine(37)-N1)-methyltransferase TrmD [Eubacterium sp.]|nr:tRNA (guanosine(37)-N1)-methyltransferase TrmD [Eubacterium sp.]